MPQISKRPRECLYRPLTDSGVKQIASGAMRILARSGARVYSARSREALARAGAEVCSDNLTVKFPRTLVEDAIASAPSAVTLCGREERYDACLDGSRVYYGTGGTAIYVLDRETGARRKATLRDVRENARLMHALPNVDLFTINVFPNDIAIPAEVDVNRFYWSIKNTTKHVMGGVYSLEGAARVVTIAALLAGGAGALAARPFISFITLIVSPFKVDAMYGDIICMLAEKGIPVVTPTEPVCGTTSPVTLASNVLMHVAETLVGVTLVQAVRKGAPVVAGSVGSITNLQSMCMVTGGIERAMINSATAQMARHFRLPFYSTAGNSDAKVEDAQAGAESALSNLLVGMSGATYIHDAAGLMDQDLTVSYDKLVMDDEIIGMCRRVLRGIEVNDDTLALELLEQVGPGGNYMAEEHTVAHMRGEFYKPELADRSRYDEWVAQGASSMRDRARLRRDALLNRCVVPDIPAALERSIRAQFPEIRG